MPPDRALDLCRQCVRNRMAIIMGEEYIPLPEASLAELLEACRIVGELEPVPDERGGKRIPMTVDPRALAASYAFEHYGRDPYDLLEAVGFRVNQEDED